MKCDECGEETPEDELESEYDEDWVKHHYCKKCKKGK